MREISEIKENLNVSKEQSAFSEQPEVSELSNRTDEIAKFQEKGDEDDRKVAAKEKKRADNSRLQSLSGGLVAAVAAAAVIIAPNMLTSPKLDKFDVNALTTSLEYNISTAEENLENLVVELTGFSIKKTAKLSEATDGAFENLLPNTVYTVAVKGNFGLGETTLEKKTVKTLPEPVPTPPSELMPGKVSSIQIEMNYETDILKFRADVLDENSFLSEFKARLISSAGTAQDIKLTEQITEWQGFDVSGLSSGNYTFEISAISQHPSHNGERLIYRRKIRI